MKLTTRKANADAKAEIKRLKEEAKIAEDLQFEDSDVAEPVVASTPSMIAKHWVAGNCCPTDVGLYLGYCDATTLPPIVTTVSPTIPSPSASLTTK